MDRIGCPINYLDFPDIRCSGTPDIRKVTDRIESNQKINYPCGSERIMDILKIQDIRSVPTLKTKY